MKRMLTFAGAMVAGWLVCLTPAPVRCAAQTVEHTIQSGDNLHLIAGYYYGNPRQWKKIWKANRKTLSAPGRLVPGRTLKIENFTDDGFTGSYDDFRSRVRGK